MLLKVIASALEDVSVLCLALSCKRLCGLYQTFVDKMDRKLQNELWNNKNGNWKKQLVPLLTEGWIPRDRIRMCPSCWRFLGYGDESGDFWRQYLIGELCNEGLRTEKISEWLSNWEIKTWLGKRAEGLNGKAVNAADQRMRCPGCTVKGRSIGIQIANKEVRRGEEKPQTDPSEKTPMRDPYRPNHWRKHRKNRLHKR